MVTDVEVDGVGEARRLFFTEAVGRLAHAANDLDAVVVPAVVRWAAAYEGVALLGEHALVTGDAET